ncbi:MAG: DUF488 domain-containing protein [Deltaproteobacteria bacterium]|nr:MAG: DUF488 domain-containing protein [Deltaproteobacteria bacterium]
MRVFTIGVYGFTERTFFDALQSAGVDLVCDVRWRRGVRGARYAFANSRRLQSHLDSLGIAYLHRRDLAPSPEIRRLQQQADKAAKTAKRSRARLAPAFVDAYRREILVRFDPRLFLAGLPPGIQSIALLCVEKYPAACHRSLITEQLLQTESIETIRHILPP